MKILIKTIKRFVLYYVVDIIRTWRACRQYENSHAEFIKGIEVYCKEMENDNN